MSRTRVREYGLLVAAVIGRSLCIPKHFGFIVIFAVPFAAAWIVYSIIVAVRSPARRRVQASKALVLAATFSLIAAAHLYYARASRADAQEVADAVLNFKAREGRFPEHAAQLGIDEVQLQRKWMLRYLLVSGKPWLIYAMTFTPFEAYDFDFGTRTWLYRPD